MVCWQRIGKGNSCLIQDAALATVIPWFSLYEKLNEKLNEKRYEKPG